MYIQWYPIGSLKWVMLGAFTTQKFASARNQSINVFFSLSFFFLLYKNIVIQLLNIY